MPQFKMHLPVTLKLRANLDDFQEAYLGYVEAMYFADTGDEGQPPATADMALEAQFHCMQDVAEFMLQVERAGLLAEYADHPDTTWRQFGHDFFLTSQGHGTGFWDRGLGDLGDRITDLAKVCGSCDFYEGDDGLIYC